MGSKIILQYLMLNKDVSLDEIENGRKEWIEKGEDRIFHKNAKVIAMRY